MSYKVIDRNVNITDTDITISYELYTSCPNYGVRCNIPGHGRSFVYDWGNRANVTAMYKLDVTVRLYRPPFTTETVRLGPAGFSISRDFYRGSPFN